MFKIKDALEINKYGQNLTDINSILDSFKHFDLNEKRGYLDELLWLIQQSKPNDEDVEPAIQQSKLKSTYTPCVLLKKGVAPYKLRNIIILPESELEKAVILLISLYKIAYQRRFNEEKNFGGKWWYSDLSDENNVNEIEKLYQGA